MIPQLLLQLLLSLAHVLCSELTGETGTLGPPAGTPTRSIRHLVRRGRRRRRRDGAASGRGVRGRGGRERNQLGSLERRVGQLAEDGRHAPHQLLGEFVWVQRGGLIRVGVLLQVLLRGFGAAAAFAAFLLGYGAVGGFRCAAEARGSVGPREVVLRGGDGCHFHGRIIRLRMVFQKSFETSARRFQAEHTTYRNILESLVMSLHALIPLEH